MTVSIVERLRNKLGPDKIRTDDQLLQERRHDYSIVNQLNDMQGRGAEKPICVALPKNRGDVVDIINLCRESKVAVIPFGLGSGVVAGVVAHADAVLLDLGSMNRIKKIDKHNLMATFEAGVRGSDAEAAVAKEGMTIGHFPQSIDISSVGGWLATRSCGQFSSAYGSVEDIVMGLEVVLPNGEILQTRLTPRSSAGPELKHFFIGSEGTMGIITAVTFSLRWKAEKQDYSAYYAPTMEKGLEFQRYVIQSGWTVPVMRQYDITEVKRLFPDQVRNEDSLIIMVHEGPAGKVAAELKECREIAADLGCDPAPEAAATLWLKDRNHVPSFDEFLKKKLVLDTIEIAATWDKIGPIYRNALASLNEVENILNASAHSSHCYRSGVNLYFTFVALVEDPSKMESVYYDCWRRVMEATVEGGGGISHHHGIGRIRRDWLPSEIGQTGVAVLKNLKTALDPEHIMNPEVLLRYEK
ncbi:MAG: FAD-binding oxidoreductase [Deltaproteobacteria bacterium]|nr:FAD-binding oxidoreductase [Deltaproteobacteria bacterium]